MNIQKALVATVLMTTTALAFSQGSDDKDLQPRNRARAEAFWKKQAGSDGMVTKQQMTQSMEGHWHTFDKTKSGKVKPEDAARMMMLLSGQDANP